MENFQKKTAGFGRVCQRALAPAPAPAVWYNKVSQQKGGQAMPAENERKDVQKAMAYDLLRIFEQNPDKTYTPKELKDLIDAYIAGLKQ